MSPGSIMMFGGKGGVGKTTCAAATALHYASLEGQTLAISTDATPSLSHIFAIGVDRKDIKPAALAIREIGEPEVRQMWHEKFGREVYAVFSSFVDVSYDEFTGFMTSILPGLGDEFMTDYIRELHRKGAYNAIVWDTAPLGQTLALLQTPALLEQHLRMAPRIYTRLKLGSKSRETVLDILKRWEALSAENVDFLRNEVNFTLVTIPEALAVAQLAGVFREMDKFGLKIQRLIVNNVIKEADSAFLRNKAGQQKRYLDAIHDAYSHLPVVELPLFPYEIKGVVRLQEVGKILFP